MEEINLKEVYSYFKSKLLLIVIAILVIVIIGNIYTILTRVAMYQSSSTIVLVSETTTTYSQSDLTLNQNLVSTYSEIIKSRTVLNQVIKNLDLDMTYDELYSSVTVTSVDDTEIIKITVNNESPKEAAKITDEVASVFTEEVKDIYNLENIYIIDKAEVADSPYNENIIKDNVIYLLIGIVLSCGVVFVLYYFDTTIKSSEYIEEHLGLNVIGIVPVGRKSE